MSGLNNVIHNAHFLSGSTAVPRCSDLKESVSISCPEVLPTQEEKSRLQSSQQDHRG